MKKFSLKKKIIWGTINFLLLVVFLYWWFVIRGELCLYYEPCDKTNNPLMYCNDIGNCAFVGTYTWDGNENNKEIIIPDRWDGNKVIRLGGTYGRGVSVGLGIVFPENYKISFEREDVYSYQEGWLHEIPYEYDIKNIEFKLKLGKYIKELMLVRMDDYFPKVDDKGNITLYHPVVYIECDKDNHTFYSKDGKLYYRSKDELVGDFDYAK